jgi:acetylornithine deacetylase/succinyl-diaminopimelate desuccinylase-like protein
MPHLDPSGWAEGLSATNSVVRNGKVWGRGSNDDGYNVYLILASVKYLYENKLSYPRMVLVYETGEESGGEQVEVYLKELQSRIGKVGSILVLDAEAQDYKTVWLCQSLRGIVNGVLDIQHLKSPCHSGVATGLVPCTFRIARILLSRIEDEKTGEIKLKETYVDIPQNRIVECQKIADQLGSQSVAIAERLEQSTLLYDNYADCLVAKAWKPGLAITGCDGIPAVSNGSNIIRTNTTLKLSLRLPPKVNSADIDRLLKDVLEKDPPYGAKVTYTSAGPGDGWFGKDFSSKVDQALKESTNEVFQSVPLYYGDGGSIPLCNFLSKLWPEADLLVTGCAGVDGNPHGFNENLDLGYTAKFTAFIASFLNKVSQ